MAADGGADRVLFGVGREGSEGFGGVGRGAEDVVVGCYVDGWRGGDLFYLRGGFGLIWVLVF